MSGLLFGDHLNEENSASENEITPLKMIKLSSDDTYNTQLADTFA